MKIIRLVKGQHDSLLAPISYNFYTITFPLIPSDGYKIRPACTRTELCWNYQIHTLICRLAPVSYVNFFSKTDNLSKIAIYKLYLEVEVLGLDISKFDYQRG